MIRLRIHFKGSTRTRRLQYKKNSKTIYIYHERIGFWGGEVYSLIVTLSRLGRAGGGSKGSLGGNAHVQSWCFRFVCRGWDTRHHGKDYCIAVDAKASKQLAYTACSLGSLIGALDLLQWCRRLDITPPLHLPPPAVNRAPCYARVSSARFSFRHLSLYRSILH